MSWIRCHTAGLKPFLETRGSRKHRLHKALYPMELMKLHHSIKQRLHSALHPPKTKKLHRSHKTSHETKRHHFHSLQQLTALHPTRMESRRHHPHLTSHEIKNRSSTVADDGPSDNFLWKRRCLTEIVTVRWSHQSRPTFALVCKAFHT